VARKLIVEVAADVTQYLRGLSESAKATSTLDVQVKELNVNTAQLAETQVRAAVKSTERLHQQVAAYRQIAAAAEKGSREQIAATRLAADAERKLAVSTAATAHETASFGRQAHNAERELGGFARGALSGSGIFRSFGRSLAFASGGFIAFHEVSGFIRESINAAREGVVSQRQLAAQMKASGESFAANREQIEKVADSYSKLGFTSEDVEQGLVVLERGTGNVTKSLQLLQLSADIARAKGITLAAAGQVVAKVFGGQTSALRRAVPGLEKNAHGWDLIRQAQQKMAGQAAASTTASENFSAALFNTEKIIGQALLPTLNKYLDSLGQWLTRMNESGKLQKDVAASAKFLAQAISLAKTALGPVVEAFQSLKMIVGGTKNAVYALAAAFGAFKFAQLIGWLKGTAAAVGLIGTEAEGSAAKVGLLGRAIGLLGASGLAGTGLIAGAGLAGLYMQKSAQDAAEQAQKAAAAGLIQGSKLETSLVPKIAEQISRMMAKGMSAAEILPRLKAQLGGSLKADDIIAEAFQFRAGQNPALQARVRQALDQGTNTVVNTVKQEAPKMSRKVQNAIFDAFVSRQQGRLQYAPLEAQLPGLQKIAGLLTQRIAVTRDITRKLNLEDQLLAVQAQMRDVRKQLLDQAQQTLQLGMDRAALTHTLSDDVAAFNKYALFLDKRLAAAKTVAERLDVENQIVQAIGQKQQLQAEMRQRQRDAAQKAAEATRKDAEKAAAAAQKAEERLRAAQQRTVARRQAAQFRALGLDPSGGELTPTGKALRERLGKIEDAVKGTFLDTSKTQALLDRIARVLSGNLSHISRAVRDQIKQMLDGIQQELQNHPVTKQTADPMAAFRARWARFYGAGWGTGTNIYQGAGGVSSLAPAPAGYSIQNLNLYGVQNVPQLENELLTRAAQRPQPRRGPV
jgi:hypothetical protein